LHIYVQKPDACELPTVAAWFAYCS